jgi:thioredoxin-related protein
MIKLFLSIALAYFYTPSPPGWEHDFQKVKEIASQQHKLILLNFSGSDWCGPCIRLHKEIFETETFRKYADSNLVLLNVDFPRMKKNQLSKELQKNNDDLAEKFNPKGIFPYTLLLDDQGKIIQAWEGFPKGTPQDFINQISDNKK